MSFQVSLSEESLFVQPEEYKQMTYTMRNLRKRCKEYPGGKLREIVIQYIRNGHQRLFNEDVAPEFFQPRNKNNKNITNIVHDLIYLFASNKNKNVLLEKWIEFWDLVFPDGNFEENQHQSNYFRILIMNQPGGISRVKYENPDDAPKSEKVFSLKCFSPSICFNLIQAEFPRSIILASGTL